MNNDNEDEDLQTTDDDEITIKTDVVTKIPDRLLYLIVCSGLFYQIRICFFRSEYQEFFVLNVIRLKIYVK